MEAGPMRERVTIERLNEVDKRWDRLASVPVVWAAVESQGEESYRVRVRYRADLFGLQDTVPRMRLRWKNRALIVRDVIEIDPRTEVVLVATSRQITIEDLELGDGLVFPS